MCLNFVALSSLSRKLYGHHCAYVTKPDRETEFVLVRGSHLNQERATSVFSFFSSHTKCILLLLLVIKTTEVLQ